MGRDKSFMVYKGKYLYEYPLRILEYFTEKIFISSNHTDYESLKYPTIKDKVKDLGPIGGIYSCLQKIKTEKTIVIACDLPFVSKEYVEALISASGKSSICMGIDSKAFPQPLISIFNSSVLSYLEEKIKRGDLKMRDLLVHSESRIVDLRSTIPDLDKNFININKPDDFEKFLT